MKYTPFDCGMCDPGDCPHETYEMFLEDFKAWEAHMKKGIQELANSGYLYKPSLLERIKKKLIKPRQL